VEFACYLGVLLVGNLPRAPRIVVLGLAAAAAIVASQLHLSVSGANLSASAGVAAYFVIGALLRHCPRRLIRPRVALLILAPWAVATVFTPRSVSEVISFAVLPYVVIAIGLASTPVVRRAARFGDFSYGIYLWAFPVQQTLLLFAPGLSPVVSIALCAVISTAVAVASWHAVEKPVLTGKGRLPWMRRQLGTVQV
jgi:peptidoglycan/LPS O-acetylase OafA/YrhL